MTYYFIPLSIILFLLLLVKKTRNSSKNHHGSSRWMTTSEIKKIGLLEENHGVILGQTKAAKWLVKTKNGKTTYTLKNYGKLIRQEITTHVLIVAPTRGGKGVGYVVPTLLSWTKSIFVFDMKGELFLFTALYRKKFSYIVKFAPAEKISSRWNPFDEVKYEEDGLPNMGDVQNLATILIDPSKSSADPFWDNSAISLATVSIAYILSSDYPDKNFQGLYALINSTKIKETMETIVATSSSAIIQNIARSIVNMTPNVRGTVVAAVNAKLQVFIDPTVAANTATSDFKIADLQNAKHPLTLYFCVNGRDADRMMPLQKMLLSFIKNELSYDMNKKNHELLLLLDEFPNMGRLDFIESWIAVAAGQGIKMMLIVQNLGQLFKLYSKETPIMGNTEVKVFLGSSDIAEARLIAELCGRETITAQSNSKSNNGSIFNSNNSTSQSEQGKDLILPDDIMRLPYTEALIVIFRQLPYKSKKVMYYADKRFNPLVNQDAEKQGFIPELSTTEQLKKAAPPRPITHTFKPIFKLTSAKIDYDQEELEEVDYLLDNEENATTLETVASSKIKRRI